MTNDNKIWLLVASILIGVIMIVVGITLNRREALTTSRTAPEDSIYCQLAREFPDSYMEVNDLEREVNGYDKNLYNCN